MEIHNDVIKLVFICLNNLLNIKQCTNKNKKKKEKKKKKKKVECLVDIL